MSSALCRGLLAIALLPIAAGAQVELRAGSYLKPAIRSQAPRFWLVESGTVSGRIHPDDSHSRAREAQRSGSISTHQAFDVIRPVSSWADVCWSATSR